MLQVKVEGEFMFGPDWLVVPITQPKVSQWKVYLPRWNVQIIYILHAYLLVVITFSKADAERLRLIKREFRLTSD